MGILNWLFKQPRYKRFEDAFMLTRARLWEALRQSIDSPEHSAKAIWLIAHFPDTFTELQNNLGQWSRDYEVITSPIEPQKLEHSGLLCRDSIKLILADLVPETFPDHPSLMTDNGKQLGIIIVERHPDFNRDQRLLNFAKSLPVKVELGYFLALDDVVIKSVVNETTVEILKQLGLDEHELITSNMITRRLDTVLKRLGADDQNDWPADSAAEWLEKNRGT